MIYQFEQAINIAKGCVMASAMDNETKMAVLEMLNLVDISKTETTSCERCDGEEHCISKARWTRLLMRGKTITASGDENASVEINFCPNCGRRLNNAEV